MSWSVSAFGVHVADPQQTESLVDELEAVVNRNLAEDGRLDEHATVDVVDVEEDLAEQVEEEEEDVEEDEEPEPLDLDTDFAWDEFPEMKPSKRRWPSHDYSILFQPSAINRYVTDYLSLIARTEKVARVLSRVRVYDF